MDILTINCRSCARPTEVYVKDADNVEREGDTVYYELQPGENFSCGWCGRWHREGTLVSVREDA